MKQISLTDRESKAIRNIVRYGDSYPSADREALIAKRTATAQLKKVMERAKQEGVINSEGQVSVDSVLHYNFWQALLKEVEG